MYVVGREALTSGRGGKKYTFPPPWHKNYETKEMLTLLGRSCSQGCRSREKLQAGCGREKQHVRAGGGYRQRGAAGGVTGAAELQEEAQVQSGEGRCDSPLEFPSRRALWDAWPHRSTFSSWRRKAYAAALNMHQIRTQWGPEWGRRVSGLQPYLCVLPSFKLLSQFTLVLLDPWITATTSFLSPLSTTYAAQRLPQTMDPILSLFCLKLCRDFSCSWLRN